jgi:hypothetical protein
VRSRRTARSGRHRGGDRVRRLIRKLNEVRPPPSLSRRSHLRRAGRPSWSRTRAAWPRPRWLPARPAVAALIVLAVAGGSAPGGRWRASPGCHRHALLPAAGPALPQRRPAGRQAPRRGAGGLRARRHGQPGSGPGSRRPGAAPRRRRRAGAGGLRPGGGLPRRPRRRCRAGAGAGAPAAAQAVKAEPAALDTLKAAVAMALGGPPDALARAAATLQARAQQGPFDEDAAVLLARRHGSRDPQGPRAGSTGPGGEASSARLGYAGLVALRQTTPPPGPLRQGAGEEPRHLAARWSWRSSPSLGPRAGRKARPGPGAGGQDGGAR